MKAEAAFARPLAFVVILVAIWLASGIVFGSAILGIIIGLIVASFAMGGLSIQGSRWHFKFK